MNMILLIVQSVMHMQEFISVQNVNLTPILVSVILLHIYWSPVSDLKMTNQSLSFTVNLSYLHNHHHNMIFLVLHESGQ